MITIQGDIHLIREKEPPLTLEEMLNPGSFVKEEPRDALVIVTFRVPCGNTTEFLDMLRKYGMDVG